MLSTARSRAILQVSRSAHVASRRCYAFSTNDKQEINASDKPKEVPNVSKTNEISTDSLHETKELQESVQKGEKLRTSQAPNRFAIWSRSQNPRPKAMSGPRFEQTIMEFQPAPQAAIELSHKQPVRWTHKRFAECDGGGGPLGHPKIFINVDKPQICPCEYCGLPYAYEHHRAHLESLPAESLQYPLSPTGDAVEVPESQRITNEALGQR
ncbi:hypothetical protein B0O99DRAFT_638066 [Bisporella sp. PMI_857]|nr:hypothetical protein B0O99DRAFT_638066 [Bisporella sp. PMI_857]